MSVFSSYVIRMGCLLAAMALSGALWAAQVGIITKGANLRAGPGTSNPVVTKLPKDTDVEVLERRGNWYQIQATTQKGSFEGWVYKSLIQVDETGVVAAPSAGAAAGGQQGQTNLAYHGYSLQFQPIKQKLVAGQADQVQAIYAQEEQKYRKQGASDRELVRKVGFLRWLERGTLALDLGRFDASLEGFRRAEQLLGERKQETKAKGWFKKVFSTGAGALTGNQEIGEYRGAGFERVLMLNYKSLAYLLEGERRAYNVTRRAIDWQNIEKKAFDQKLQEAKEKLAEERRKQVQGQAQAHATTNQVQGEVGRKFTALDAKANAVPSAFVNPFGYYVAGMIQEYEGYDDWSLRDNARISYQKALKLNPKSRVLKQAVKDMKRRKAPKGTRLVHVVVGDGFVPEKKVLTYGLRTGRGAVPIKLDIYQPVPSRVARIEVQTVKGKRLARLSPVADIEAICLRYQKDLEPMRKLKIFMAVVSSVVVRGALQSAGWLGEMVADARDQNAAPDTRSWMSLPATMQAARLHLRKGVKALRITSYDRRGRRLASKVVKIHPKSHDFVYARSMDQALYAHAADKLWVRDI